MHKHTCGCHRGSTFREWIARCRAPVALQDEAGCCSTRLVPLTGGGGGGGGGADSAICVANGLSYLEKLAKTSSSTLLCSDQWQTNQAQLQSATQRVAVLVSLFFY